MAMLKFLESQARGFATRRLTEVLKAGLAFHLSPLSLANGTMGGSAGAFRRRFGPAGR